MVGQKFVSGHQYGPIQLEFEVNANVDVYMGHLGNWSNEIGIIIRDKSGAIAFKLSPGKQYSHNTKLG